MARRSWDEAEKALHAFTQKNPDVIDGWLMLMEVGYATRQPALLWNANRHLLALEPHEEAHRYNAVVTFHAACDAVCGLAAHQDLPGPLARRHPPPGVREMQALPNRPVRICWKPTRWPQGADPADLALFEESQTLVSSGHLKEGLSLSLHAAQKLPHAAAPRNNISMSYAAEGKLVKAVACTQRGASRTSH